MSGWVVMIGMGLASALVILAFVKGRRQLWQPVLATVILAMAGYAWQGSPALPSAPAKPIAAERGAAEALIKMRSDMDQNYGVAKMWLVTADGFARDGSYAAASGYIQAGLRQHPENADLWSALGLVLMLASDGELTLPAKLAFDKARTLAPNLPAPDYFEGLAALFDRKPDQTIAKWNQVLGRASPKAKWRPAVESQLAGLESLLAGASMSSDEKEK
ncbi:MAG: cytochrome c biogenesis factor [Sphingorhabdus sp.]|uniref:tetratricopeptide repeat protein n=1 Tax=Sphingorhabdus sp. TaxID=1902408 RepID=UPI003C9B41E1